MPQTKRGIRSRLDLMKTPKPMQCEKRNEKMKSSVMNFVSHKLIVLAPLIALTLSSCASTEKRLTTAAQTVGKMSAGINLPDLPDDCRRKEPHAPIVEGAEVRTVLVRERAALDRQNLRTERCAKFYDETQKLFLPPK